VKDVAVHDAGPALPAAAAAPAAANAPSFPPVARMRQRAAAFWLNGFFAACRHVPWVAGAVKPLFVWGATAFSHQIQRATAANARRIFGSEISDVRCREFARAVTGHFYDFVADVGRAARLTPQQMYQRVCGVEGFEHYTAARAHKRGAIVVTAHMGSFEVGLAALRQHEQRVHVVFRRDPADRFDQIRQLLRQRLGVLEAPVEDGWGLWIRLRDALMADEVVVVQGDRVMAGQKGQRVRFGDHHIMLPTGPVKLAQASGAPLVPIFSLREPDGKIRIVIEEPFEVRADDETDPLDRLARALEKHVRARPEQWLMFHPAFCEDIDASNRGTTNE
jgi:lauroyl/myristoyl acyltransferase